MWLFFIILFIIIFTLIYYICKDRRVIGGFNIYEPEHMGNISGPVNAARLEGDGKVVYLFFDYHPLETECHNPEAVEFPQFLYNELKTIATTRNSIDVFIESGIPLENVRAIPWAGLRRIDKVKNMAVRYKDAFKSVRFQLEDKRSEIFGDSLGDAFDYLADGNLSYNTMYDFVKKSYKPLEEFRDNLKPFTKVKNPIALKMAETLELIRQPVIDSINKYISFINYAADRLSVKDEDIKEHEPSSWQLALLRELLYATYLLTEDIVSVCIFYTDIALLELLQKRNVLYYGSRHCINIITHLVKGGYNITHLSYGPENATDIIRNAHPLSTIPRFEKDDDATIYELFERPTRKVYQCIDYSSFPKGFE